MTQQLLIPAYFYPGTDPTDWTAMHSAPAGSVIIANVASGPGSSSDPVYVAAIAAAQAAGQRVVGYVATSGSLPTMKSQIDQWKLWYSVDGIFVDEVTGGSGDEAFYTSVAAYIRSAPGGLVVFNCGTPPLVAYISIADITCILEDTYVALTGSYENPSYANPTNAAKLAIIVHDASSAQAQAAVYQTIFYSVQYCYVTDGTGANPYSSLPSYWTTLLSLVNAGASLGPVLQWFENFESYPVGAATLGAPWTAPARTLISNTIFQGTGTKSLGLGTGGFSAAPTRTFAQGDLGPQWTVDMWVYMPTGSGVAEPPVINSPIMAMSRISDGSGAIQFLLGAGGTYYIGETDAQANQWFTGSVSLDTWHRFTLGVTMARDPSSGSAYLIVDGGSLQTFSGNTQTNGGSSVVDAFEGIGQFIAGSPVAEAYIDNVAIYRGAFTPSSGGGAKPFAHMLPAGLIEPIPPAAALAIAASAKIRRFLRDNPVLRRREILRRLLDE